MSNQTATLNQVRDTAHKHGACTCGHDHSRADLSQGHVHAEGCGCGHSDQPPDSSVDDESDHPAHAHADSLHGRGRAHTPAGGSAGQLYLLENLGCANCAAKMERQIAALPGVESCTITYATKQLRLNAANPEALLPRIREVCTSIEPDVRVLERRKPSARQAEKTGGASERKAGSENRKALRSILLGAALFVAGELLMRANPLWAAALFVAAYLILGGKILLRAAKNIIKGQIFDENFLMSVATLGAFAIREFPEAVGVMLFYRVGEYFEHRAVEKSRGQIMQAVDMRPETVNLVTGQSIRVIEAEQAQVGDILLVRPGDRIPLDGVVTEGQSRIDTSPVTGEPVPVAVSPGSQVLSGCVNTSGAVRLRVEKVLAESMVTRILDSVENAAASKPRIDRFITRFARVYTPIVLAFALGVAVIPPLFTGQWQYWIYTALTFLVISCPCALVLSVPLAFFSGIGAGSRRGILFKGGVTLESLNSVKAVVMDKTGTVTKGNFVVRQVMPASGMDGEALLALAAGCETASTHPIAVSIGVAAGEKGLAVPAPSSIEEVAGQGIVARFADSQVLCGNRRLLESRGVRVEAADTASADTEVLLARDGSYVGRLLIADEIKPEAARAVADMKRLGVTTAMLTGDSLERAREVAEQVGIEEVHARLLPENKVSELLGIREKRGAVLFVGDGINDAPVLAAADVGAAMGSGADAAIEVADLVFMNSDLQAVPQSIELAKATCRIAVQNVVFALAVKLVVMAVGLTGHASMWMAVFADTGVSLLCMLNSIRILYKK